MSSTVGNHLKLTIFGQSHGPSVGMRLEGVPAGLPVDFEALQNFMNRRAPGHSAYASARKEPDIPIFSSGITDGYTDGSTISAEILNTDARRTDYPEIMDIPRPGHADYTAYIKYGGAQDLSGGGEFSGRVTAPMCIAGGLCLQWLSHRGIAIGAHIASIGDIADDRFSPLAPELSCVHGNFPVLSHEQGEKMKDLIAQVQKEGDSIGGIIECAITGLPGGLGGPLFQGMEKQIVSTVFGIPAVKGVEFGDGFASAFARGSKNNDGYTVCDGAVTLLSNHAGGILGGITSGAPLLFRVAIKPTPSISLPQRSVSLSAMEDRMLCIKGRHDPCIVPRAVPVVEAAAALAVFDLLLDYDIKE